MTHRLSSIAPDLSELLTHLPEGQQRAVACKAADWAVSAVRVSDPRLDAGRRLLPAQEGGSDLVTTDLATLVDELDAAAFHLQDVGDEDGYAKGFARARAVHAVLFAIGRDAAEAALEASYEALIARDLDVEGLRFTIHQALRS